MTSCAIIIPAVSEDYLLQNCIKNCISQSWKNIKIYLVLDNIPEKRINDSRLSYLRCEGHISKKRNFAAKHSKEKYLAFIDSDAYPENKWIENGINYLLKNKNFEGLITGPDLAFPNEKGIEKILSYVNKSIFISGSKNYRKKINSKSKIVKQASSCNMLIERSLYENIGGMDEDVYVGEDIAFCNKLNNKNKKIYFLNNFTIYHKTRSLVPFFAQRFVYGTSVISSFKHSGLLKNFEFFIPFFIVILPIIIFIFFNKFFLLNVEIYFLISLIVIFEALYISNVKNFLIVYVVILISTVLFGLGTMTSLFISKKKVNKIYLHR